MIYAFADVTATGDCVSLDAKDDGINFPQLVTLKATYPQLGVLISVGGASHSTNFSVVADDDGLRTQFAQSSVQFMTENGFDGIDIDWEFPESGDSSNFTALLQALRTQLDAQGVVDGREYLLTIAAPAGAKNIANLQLPQVHPLLDWINLETYDFTTAHSTVTNFNAPLFTHKGDRSVDAAVKGYLGEASRPRRLSWECALSAPAGRELVRRIMGFISPTPALRWGRGISRGCQPAVSDTRISRTTISAATRVVGIKRRRLRGSITAIPGS